MSAGLRASSTAARHDSQASCLRPLGLRRFHLLTSCLTVSICSPVGFSGRFQILTSRKATIATNGSRPDAKLIMTEVTSTPRRLHVPSPPTSIHKLPATRQAENAAMTNAGTANHLLILTNSHERRVTTIAATRKAGRSSDSSGGLSSRRNANVFMSMQNARWHIRRGRNWRFWNGCQRGAAMTDTLPLDAFGRLRPGKARRGRSDGYRGSDRKPGLRARRLGGLPQKQVDPISKNQVARIPVEHQPDLLELGPRAR